MSTMCINSNPLINMNINYGITETKLGDYKKNQRLLPNFKSKIKLDKYSSISKDYSDKKLYKSNETTLYNSYFNLFNKDKILNKFKNNEINYIIKTYEYISELEYDWNGEGALGIEKNVWDNSINILKGIYDKLPSNIIEKLPSPSILPTINGDIDISWINDDFSVLISTDRESESYFNINIGNKNFGGSYDEDIFISNIQLKLGI